MKKTFTINISGSIFHIDDDAFEKLQKYLHMLNKHFNAAIEGQEILQDIEARISELFIEKTNNKAEVITDAMVDEVIVRKRKQLQNQQQKQLNQKLIPKFGDVYTATQIAACLVEFARGWELISTSTR